MTLSRWLRRIAPFLLFLTLAISPQTFASDTVVWTEEARLHDNRVIIVERHASSSTELRVPWPFIFHFEKSDFDKHRVKFTHPKTQEPIVWQGERHFLPVLIDIVKDIPYLVVYGRPDKNSAKIYGCPELPYIYLQYTANRWAPLPVEQAPAELQNANLLVYDLRSKAGRHFSAEDVRKDVQFYEGQSYGQVQARVPRAYEDWHTKFKNGARNDRKFGDCRPPRVPPLPVALTAPREDSPDILETINYTPDRISIGDDWSQLVFDKKREGECKKMFRSTDPDDNLQGQRFVNDSTGKKPVPYSRTAQFEMGVRVLCDEHVWFVTHQEKPGKIVISKFTVSGDLIYRISFPNPDQVKGFVGYIRIPSLRSDGGYLYFDWLDFRDINREWHIKRWLKMRLREPESTVVGSGK